MSVVVCFVFFFFSWNSLQLWQNNKQTKYKAFPERYIKLSGYVYPHIAIIYKITNIGAFVSPTSEKIPQFTIVYTWITIILATLYNIT